MKMQKKINFDVCTFCNHACDFCSNPDKRTKKATTSLKDFITTMDNVMQYVETSEMGLSAKGEVCLNKELESIIKACKTRYKIPYVYISSNGALLNPARAKSLLESGLDSVKFSINAVDKEQYKQVHNRDDFDKVIENFKALIELKKSQYPHLRLFISSVLTSYNAKNPKEAFNKIFGKDAEFINAIWHYERSWTMKDSTNSLNALNNMSASRERERERSSRRHFNTTDSQQFAIYATRIYTSNFTTHAA